MLLMNNVIIVQNIVKLVMMKIIVNIVLTILTEIQPQNVHVFPDIMKIIQIVLLVTSNV